MTRGKCDRPPPTSSSSSAALQITCYEQNTTVREPPGGERASQSGCAAQRNPARCGSARVGSTNPAIHCRQKFRPPDRDKSSSTALAVCRVCGEAPPSCWRENRPLSRGGNFRHCASCAPERGTRDPRSSAAVTQFAEAAAAASPLTAHSADGLSPAPGGGGRGCLAPGGVLLFSGTARINRRARSCTEIRYLLYGALLRSRTALVSGTVLGAAAPLPQRREAALPAPKVARAAAHAGKKRDGSAVQQCSKFVKLFVNMWAPRRATRGGGSGGAALATPAAWAIDRPALPVAPSAGAAPAPPLVTSRGAVRPATRKFPQAAPGVSSTVEAEVNGPPLVRERRVWVEIQQRQRRRRLREAGALFTNSAASALG
ncbi:uncharacterized protein LOC126136093 [Schistocerca cancellata]|uniref:uncharacterized protein LOC126136093 n=1 Tax=Schistocerca cancellata TaxID=274614 RepID=UPI0021183A7E|nr:uncharacterized protein LOC126136093 [Schistocerca cancellata]